ncbi:MAG TPA: hypothetical protein VFU19_15600 [Iamia sp.]|nr:hypothetical protein [Iamia sp.]
MTPSSVPKPPLFDRRRLVETVPELDTAEKRSGATFVNILFGLVVSAGVGQVVFALREGYLADDPDAINATRLSHLGLALLVTTLSWIGYHQSQKYPPFLIKFVNIPLFTFALDVAMVASYYGLIATAENPGGGHEPVIGASARPEAGLILVVFVLYVAWDEAGFRLFRDPEYSFRMQAPRPPEETRGTRRMVTLAALAAAVAIFGVVAVADPSTPATVIAVDGLLALLVIAYRLAKQGVQDTVVLRGADPKEPVELTEWRAARAQGA